MECWILRFEFLCLLIFEPMKFLWKRRDEWARRLRCSETRGEVEGVRCERSVKREIFGLSVLCGEHIKQRVDVSEEVCWVC